MRRRTQADIVEETLKELGGYATLSELYQRIDTSQWGTQTPRATIRRILQKDPKKRFVKIRPGLWGLARQHQTILRKLGIDEQASEKDKQQFDHTYYQAILLEIGNTLNYHTTVAYQDKSRVFAGKKLGEISSLGDFPKFTYEVLVRKARSVDVIWFKEYSDGCLFPALFFEIEHTTDFNRSLIKLGDFGFLAAKFCIVAARRREEEFHRTLRQEVFRLLRERVEFLAYEDLEKDYEKMQGSQQLRLARMVGTQ